MPLTIDDLGKSGKSLRSFLREQGVTDEKAMQKHMQFVLDTESRIGRRLDLDRYRVDPSNPNQFPPQMG